MTITIRAAVAREPGAPLTIEDLSMEAPRADEIRVRVVAVGVCHTDLVVRDGEIPVPFPVVLCHEGAGIVEEVGSAVTKVAPGDHVVMTFNACGACPTCREHATSYCHESFPRNFGAARPDGSSPLSGEGEQVHGYFFGQSSFATHAICREINVVKVPDDVPLELLGPLACGVQTGAGAVMNSFKVGANKTFAVFGAGSVGLSALMAAKVVCAAKIIAVDTNDERLAVARELGATHVVNPKTEDPAAAIMAATGYGVDFALDTTGIETVILAALDSLAPRGTAGILGASARDSVIPLKQGLLRGGGRRIMGIIEGDSDPDIFIPLMIELYRQGRFPFDKLIRFYRFDEINEAIHDSATGCTIKPVLQMA